MKSRDKEALQKILGVIQETEEIIKNISVEEFLEKPLYKMAMTMAIYKTVTDDFTELKLQIEKILADDK